MVASPDWLALCIPPSVLRGPSVTGQTGLENLLRFCFQACLREEEEGDVKTTNLRCRCL